MIAIPLAVALMSAEPQTDSGPASDAAEAAASAAAAAHEAVDTIAAIEVFREHPQVPFNSKLVAATIAAEHRWHVCVSNKVERWKALEEPVKTILDAAFDSCGIERVMAITAYEAAFSNYATVTASNFAQLTLARAEERLRGDLTPIILEAKVSYQW